MKRHHFLYSLFICSMFIGGFLSGQIVRLATFLFETIPFVMLYRNPGQTGADRLNIVGILWMFGFGVFLAVRYFEPIGKLKDFVRNLMIAGVSLVLVHHITDGGLNVTFFLFNIIPRVESVARIVTAVFASGFILYYVYIQKSPLNGALGFSRNSLYWLVVLSIWWVTNSFLGIGDFAMYQGWERIWRFWLHYPLNYLLVSGLCLSIVRKRRFS